MKNGVCLKKNIFNVIAFSLLLCSVAQNYGAAESSAEEQARWNKELVQAYDNQDYAVATYFIKQGADPLTLYLGKPVYLRIVAARLPAILESLATELDSQVCRSLLCTLSKELSLMGEMEKKGVTARLKAKGRVYADRIRQQLKESQLPQVKEIYEEYRKTYEAPSSVSVAKTPQEQEALLRDAILAGEYAGNYDEARDLIDAGEKEILGVKVSGKPIFLGLAISASEEADRIAGMKTEKSQERLEAIELLTNFLELIAHMQNKGVEQVIADDTSYRGAQRHLIKISKSPSPDVQRIFVHYFPDFGEQPEKSAPDTEPGATEAEEYTEYKEEEVGKKGTT